MKKDIHPEYRPVVIQDISSDFAFLTSSAGHTEETIKWEDGKTYPLIKVEISSASHPFYTGKQQLVDTAGRVDKFKKRVEKAGTKKVKHSSKTEKLAKKKAKKDAKAKEAVELGKNPTQKTSSKTKTKKTKTPAKPKTAKKSKK